MKHDNNKPTLNPTAMTPDDAARLMAKVGGHRTDVELLQEDIASGAPTNPDGTLNLVHYAAWLVKEMGRGN